MITISLQLWTQTAKAASRTDQSSTSNAHAEKHLHRATVPSAMSTRTSADQPHFTL
jgi:hypothetical protein